MDRRKCHCHAINYFIGEPNHGYYINSGGNCVVLTFHGTSAMQLHLVDVKCALP